MTVKRSGTILLQQRDANIEDAKNEYHYQISEITRYQVYANSREEADHILADSYYLEMGIAVSLEDIEAIVAGEDTESDLQVKYITKAPSRYRGLK